MKQYPDEFKASIITKLLAPNNAVPHVTPLIPVPVVPTHKKLFKPGPEAVVQAVREAMGWFSVEAFGFSRASYWAQEDENRVLIEYIDHYLT